MMEIKQQIIGLGAMLCLYGILWLANMVFGIANSLNKGEQWDWRRFIAGWRTAALGAFGLVLTVSAVMFIPQVFQQNGIMVGEDWQKAISLLSIIASIAGGILSYAKKAVANIAQFINPDRIEMKIKTNPTNWNKGSIETVTGKLTSKELMEED